MGNYIKIERKILDWEWYGDINTCRVFLHLLLKANWKDGRFQGTEVKRGSLVSSIRRLSEETALTEREVRTAILHLKTTGEVTSISHSKFTVFTIKNYDVYQSNDTQNDEETTIERQACDTGATGKRQSNDKRTTTIEEGKKEKKESREEGKQENREAEKKKVSPRGGGGQTDLDALLQLDYFQGLADNEPLITAVRNWLQYKAERRDAYKPSGLKSLLTKIQKEAAVYGTDVIVELIEESMANQWRGIIWERAEKLVKGKGPETAAGGRKPEQKPKTHFHNFESRGYDYNDAIMKDIREKFAAKKGEVKDEQSKC